ncbi:ABC transporter ATP-binding protein [Desulfococcaceae bacterium HSG9]|nr:ABC transporter ATP-binding protein [Desulfococcaceae bacterium HSG9]
MNIIEIKNLSHRFANGEIGIDDINLTIREGEFVVFAGMNGSGKTTLFRHLNGLLTPSGGSVILDGISVADDPKRARRMVGMVFQNADSQIVGETVYDDVAFGPENLGLEQAMIAQRVSEALHAVGLNAHADKRPHLLSGGEKRRLAIAGILAMGSRVLVFDEPFSNLDYPGICQVLKQIVSLHHAGHTILIATHDLEKVIFHAQRLIFMKDGNIIQDGAPDDNLKEAERFGVRTPCATHFGKEPISWLT